MHLNNVLYYVSIAIDVCFCSENSSQEYHLPIKNTVVIQNTNIILHLVLQLASWTGVVRWRLNTVCLSFRSKISKVADMKIQELFRKAAQGHVCFNFPNFSPTVFCSLKSSHSLNKSGQEIFYINYS